MTELNINEINRTRWLEDNFPEWGTWLNEEIDQEVVPEGKFAMWWLACTGIWLKTAQANIAIDFWSQGGRRTKKQPPYEEIKDFQMSRMCGSKLLPPFLRLSPHVIDPFAMTQLDALFATHIHGDHICPYVAAAAVQNTETIMVGPELCGDMWREWGVPEERIKIVHPGDTVKLKDIEVVVVESFDRTVLLTPPPYDYDFATQPLPDMDERAVNYIVKTSGGSLYHSGDSHFSTGFYEQGQQHEIDVTLVSYGDNGPGIQDKVTASDCLRIGRDLGTKVFIPFHYDMWSFQSVNPTELELLYDYNKPSLDFDLYIWKVGGKFIYPDDKSKRRYNYPKGEEDFLAAKPNLPFKSFL